MGIQYGAIYVEVHIFINKTYSGIQINAGEVLIGADLKKIQCCKEFMETAWPTQEALDA
jgi:hypothetical protein